MGRCRVFGVPVHDVQDVLPVHMAAAHRRGQPQRGLGLLRRTRCSCVLQRRMRQDSPQLRSAAKRVLIITMRETHA
jgi:hypothetical protein